MQTFYDSTYVAKHLGVSKSTVINWVDRPTAAFPMPAASVRYGDRPRQENPSSSPARLRTNLSRSIPTRHPAASAILSS